MFFNELARDYTSQLPSRWAPWCALQCMMVAQNQNGKAWGRQAHHCCREGTTSMGDKVPRQLQTDIKPGVREKIDSIWSNTLQCSWKFGPISYTSDASSGIKNKHFLKQIQSPRRHIRESSRELLPPELWKLFYISSGVITSKKAKACIIRWTY